MTEYVGRIKISGRADLPAAEPAQIFLSVKGQVDKKGPGNYSTKHRPARGVSRSNRVPMYLHDAFGIGAALVPT